MAYPTKPTAAYDYPTFQAGNPTTPLPANHVLNDFTTRKTSTDQIIDFLKVTVRSDNKISAAMVPAAALAPDALALIGGDWNLKGAWAATTNYVPGDVVTFDGGSYIAIVAHTSGFSFVVDFSVGKWATLSAPYIPGGSPVVTVDTMADLQALPSRPELVIVKGFYEPGDGGGGAFPWYETDTTTIVAGMVISPMTGTAGRYKRLVIGPLYPQWFGARGNCKVEFHTVSITAGGNVLSLGSALSSVGAVGQRIFVERAGPSGRQLITAITGINGARTQITLQDNATRALTSQSIVLLYGDDDYAGLQAMMNWAYANNCSACIPPGMSGIWLITDELNWLQPVSTATNIREAQIPSLIRDSGATLKWAAATGPGKVALRYGSGSTYDQLLRDGHLGGGITDCSHVIDAGVAVPFALNTVLSDVKVINIKKDGIKVGDNAALGATGGVRVEHCWGARDTLTRAMTVTGISNAAEAVVNCADYNLDDGQVVTITGANVSAANGKFFEIERVNQGQLKLVGVDSTGWGAFVGTALMYACLPTERVSWEITGVTQANPAVMSLSQAPGKPDGTRIEIHAIEGMFQLEGVDVYLKAKANPNEFELYTDAGLTIGVNSTGYAAYSGGGFATEYVDPDAMETFIRFENSTDCKTSSNSARGIRVGIAGDVYGGTHTDNHFYDLMVDGSLYAHYRLGGKNCVFAPYLDGPLKYGFIWGAGMNDVYNVKLFHNPGSAWLARDGFPIMNKTTSGSAEVRMWGGHMEGGASSRIFSDHNGPGTYYWRGIERANVIHFPDSEDLPRNNPLFYGALTGPKFIPNGDLATTWAIDRTGVTTQIAQSGTFDLQTGSGVFSLTETQQTGFTVLCVAGNSGIVIVGNNPTAETTFVNSLSPGVGTIGIAVTGGRIRITNNIGAQITICVAGIRTRSII